MTMPIEAVLLAGGRGRRAGGPKAFKRVGGELAWRRQARLLRAAGADRVAVVVHPDRPAEDVALPVPEGVVLVVSTPEAEMFASLRAGLRALAGSAAGGAAPGLFVLPVDCPLAGRAVTDAMLQRARAAGRWQVIRPAYRGRRGHPIILAPALCAAIAGGDDDGRLDHLIATLPADARVDVEVDDAAVLANHNRDGVTR